MPKILVVDDEQVQRELLAGHLRKKGHEVLVAASGAEALERIAAETVDIMITDQKMPGMSGLELAAAVVRDHPNVTIIMVTAYGSIEDAVQAMKNGVEDYITKPVNLDELDILLERISEKRDLVRENRWLRDQIGDVAVTGDFIYGSAAMREVASLIARVAGTSATVLLTGESGTGKEIVAQTIHRASPRVEGPFIVVNSAAIPENLIESELFGHEKGAFTGAERRRTGRFEQADGGTLFLDEIGELPGPMQVKLLRVLQEQSFERVGGEETISVDVRIIAATNRDLAAEVDRRAFRRDLYYRLNVVSITIPPLRERKRDIPILATHFVDRHASRHGKHISGMTPEALDALIKYPFPGNVRELSNIVEQAVVLSRSEIIDERDLPSHVAGMSNGPPMDGTLDERLAAIEKRSIEQALEESQGNKSAAARLLGISERKIRYLIDKYGIG